MAVASSPGNNSMGWLQTHTQIGIFMHEWSVRTRKKRVLPASNSYLVITVKQCMQNGEASHPDGGEGEGRVILLVSPCHKTRVLDRYR